MPPSSNGSFFLSNEKLQVELVPKRRRASVVAITTLIMALAALSVSIIQSIIYQNQLDLGRDQEKIQFRSYVGVDSVTVNKVFKPNFQIKITFQNFGQSQAIAFDRSTLFDVQIYRYDAKYQIGNVDAWNDLAESIIFPNRSKYYEISTNLSSSDVDMLSRPNSVLLVFGRAQYIDIFGIHRHTTYCFYFRQEDLFNNNHISDQNPVLAYDCNIFNVAD